MMSIQGRLSNLEKRGGSRDDLTVTYEGDGRYATLAPENRRYFTVDELKREAKKGYQFVRCFNFGYFGPFFASIKVADVDTALDALSAKYTEGEADCAARGWPAFPAERL